jgi:acetyl-CoA carboxylase biotin carboxyl carrier protein
MALNVHEIRELIRLIDESQIEEFEMEHEGTKVVMRKAVGGRMIGTAAAAPTAAIVSVSTPKPLPASAISTSFAAPGVETGAEAGHPLQENVAVDETLHKIVSPMVGTFYRAPSPEAASYVREGDEVHPSTVVCIVEAMKLMNELEAEVKGTIVKILVENGQLVEYAQPLFLVKTD